MLTLYFYPGRSYRVAWMLEELGAPYRTVPVDLAAGEQESEAFTAISPAGKVPVLLDYEQVIYESGAICSYLADRFPEGRLAPRLEDPRRGRYLSLMFFAAASLEPAITDHLYGRTCSPQMGWGDIGRVARATERELGQGPWLFGDWFTAADVMLGSMWIWARFAEIDLSAYPSLAAYVERLVQRPACEKLFAAALLTAAGDLQAGS